MYQQHGAPDSGALCLEKAAKMIETQYPERAVELYRRGVDVVMVRYVFVSLRQVVTRLFTIMMIVLLIVVVIWALLVEEFSLFCQQEGTRSACRRKLICHMILLALKYRLRTDPGKQQNFAPSSPDC